MIGKYLGSDSFLLIFPLRGLRQIDDEYPVLCKRNYKNRSPSESPGKNEFRTCLFLQNIPYVNKDLIVCMREYGVWGKIRHGDRRGGGGFVTRQL